jgi:hypothetical protein
MEPDKFRESRLAINRQCENINLLIVQKDRETSQVCYEEVSALVDILTPKAEGEVQERSVKNLSLKLKGLLIGIEKLKPKKRPVNKARKKIAIVWDEERLGQLAPVFLQKLMKNMGDDTDAKVCLSTTGKGIRPRYQIEFGNQDIITFSGSAHTPLEKPPLTGKKNMSQPFSHEVIDSIQRKK